MSSMNPLTPLSLNESFVFVAFCGVIAHQIFRKYEPTNLIILLFLLGVLPAASSTVFIPYFSSVPYSLLIGALVHFGALLSSLVIYRLSPYHPLAKYPGPTIAKITKLWAVYQMRRGKQYLYYKHLHDKYGPYVRVGPNELSFCDVDAIGPMMGPHGMAKGPAGEGRGIGAHGELPTIAIRDPKVHASRRRYWTRGLNTHSIKDYEDAMVKRGTQLVEGIKTDAEKHNGVVNISQWMTHFAFDFMGDMAFGGGFEMMKEGDKNGIWHILESSIVPTAQLGHIPWLTFILEQLPFNFSTKLRLFSIDRANMRKEQGSVTKDLFYHLMDEECEVQDTPRPFKEVVSDALLVIVAGSDTTATVLSNTCYFLMSNPAVYHRLQEEIDAAFPLGEGDPIDTHKQAGMPYLNAVIDESLRVLPPVPSGAQRAPLIGGGGHVVGDHFIPEGTAIFIPTYALHRDPRYFSPSPEKFWPERWLHQSETDKNDEGKNNVKFVHNTAAFIPFSFGPSNCAGKGLAMVELRLILCMLLQRFTIRFVDGYDPRSWEKTLEDFIVMKKTDLPIVVTSRV